MGEPALADILLFNSFSLSHSNWLNHLIVLLCNSSNLSLSMYSISVNPQWLTSCIAHRFFVSNYLYLYY